MILCVRFRVSSSAFFQVNTVSAERLYEIAAQWAACQPNTILFDICCGTGTIGLSITNTAKNNIKKLIGLELNESAVCDAKFNAQLNGFYGNYETSNSTNYSDDNNGGGIMKYAEFIAGRAELTLGEALDKHIDSKDDTVVAILDPPRSGVHATVCKLLRETNKISKIVYVSCNSRSCFDDCVRLCQAPSKRVVGFPFKPIKVLAVDLFPHTQHVEMVMLLERCTIDDIDESKLSSQARKAVESDLYKKRQKLLRSQGN